MSAFFVTNTHLNRVILALRACGVWHHHDLDTRIGVDTLGSALADLNARAVNGRYGTHEPPVQFKFEYTSKPLSNIELFKALQCYVYQCEEDATLRDPLYSLLGEAKLEFAQVVIAKLPEYNSIPWAVADAGEAR